MTYEIQIITASDNHYEPFLMDLNQRLQWITQRGYVFSVAANGIEDSESIMVNVKMQGKNETGVFRHEDMVYIFKHQLAEILAEHIINKWEAEFLWKEILRNCRGTTNEERQQVFEKSSSLMRKCHENDSLNLIMNYGRKNRIAHRLFDFMNDNNQIVVEGFVTFCLRDYINEMKFSVELACEEMRTQKEYNDFVNLLRYFVDTQTSRIREVNLMLGDGGNFHLWDGDGNQIDEQFMNYYLDDMLMEEISLDDVLVSILITIAPQHIILHNSSNLPNTDSVQMIRKVFKERIIECRGCERCDGTGVRPLHN
ncbi:MAG: hypothetical protein GXY34_02280 [Syntrophomonadaceae bacterium]|nr:hypothetical protein [Syntrophomonadaceae bacterium]